MSALWGAEVVVVVHLAYLVYAAVGGFLALRWRAWLWPHLVSTAWSVVVTVTAVRCPLTALESWLLGRRGSRSTTTASPPTTCATCSTRRSGRPRSGWAMMALAVTSYVLVVRSWRRAVAAVALPSLSRAA